MRLFKGSELLYLVVAISFLFILSSSISEPIRPLFITQVGATTFELGLIMALRSLIALLTRVPVSILSGRLGKWRLMLLSLVLLVLTNTLFAFVYDPIWFYLIMPLSALSWSLFSPITLVIISDQSTPSTRGAIMGVYFTAIGAALLVGPLLCSLLILFLDIRQLFLIGTAFTILALIVFLLKAKRQDIEGTKIFDRVKSKDDENPWNSAARIFRNKNVIALCYARAVFAISFSVFSTLFPVYAKSLGLTPSLIALLFSLRGITNVLTRTPSGRLSDRIGRRKPFVLAYFIIIIVFATIQFAQNFPQLTIVMALYGIGWGMRIAPSSAMLSESVASRDRSLALAIFQTMFDVGSTLGALLVSAVASLSAPTLFLLCVPIMLSSLVAFTLITTEASNSSKQT